MYSCAAARVTGLRAARLGLPFRGPLLLVFGARASSQARVASSKACMPLLNAVICARTQARIRYVMVIRTLNRQRNLCATPRRYVGYMRAANAKLCCDCFVLLARERAPSDFKHLCIR